ncbi:protein FAR1-RELATED SEQUENCE 5, partial [Cajanus cajan]|uniref:protein FAR1-RELATED SEQUENCE 5 n=1 Tax=Cajanus cajan TaxID=3821 RepID=UPI00098DA0D9
MEYEVFGDVLAFDATYGKNKYLCPVVVFSGVNHHNHTIVFGSAIVSNETEETYIWVLGQFVEAMKGKSPMSIITDGDVAMKNAIRKVFPNSHHRLCAWHLLRNATTNIKKPAFTKDLRKCMLGEYEIGEFRKKWSEMLNKFELHDHPWVIDLFEKRKMWCTTYIRGAFFGGFRATSRCEGLHSELKKYIHPKINLTVFVQQFNRLVSYMRYREVEADFASIHGDPILETDFHNLELSGAKCYTKEIFKLFRDQLHSSSLMRVIGCKQTFGCCIYIVRKYEISHKQWHVSYESTPCDLKCSCLRMESVGIPCDHILAVLVHLNLSELPKCLVLKRWTKVAKDEVKGNVSRHRWESEKDARYLSLMEYFKELSTLACETYDDYVDKREKVVNELVEIRAKKCDESEEGNALGDELSVVIRNPAIARSKGRSVVEGTWRKGRKSKKSIKCSLCKQIGHNMRTCGRQQNLDDMEQNTSGMSFEFEESYEDEYIEDLFEKCDEFHNGVAEMSVSQSESIYSYEVSLSPAFSDA